MLPKRNAMTIVLCGLFLAIALAGCSGGGGGGGDDDDSDVMAPDDDSNVITASVAGTLAVSEGQVLDGDTNDPNDPVIENNTVAGGGQLVAVPVNVGGYANERTDVVDIYRVTLQGPTTIVLNIAEPGAGDLDLFFTDTAGMILKQSIGTGSLEIIETDAGEVGEFLVAVEAFAGASNYLLSLGSTAVTSTTLAALRHDRHFLDPEADFVVGDVIMKLRDTPQTNQSRSRQAAAFSELGLVRKAAVPSGPQLMTVADDTAPLGLRSRAGAGGSPLRYHSEDMAAKARTLSIIKQLRRNPDVEYAEPNALNQITVLPNDQFIDFQWHYSLINLPQAWDVTQGDDAIVIAVIDSGVVTTHPDLASRMLRDSNGNVIGFDFISDPANARDGDGIDPDPFDVGDLHFGARSSFHGTHVAGTIAAATNNTSGVAGVTWQGNIMPLRVLGRIGGTDFDIAQAILYAAGAANSSGTVPPVAADVINMSLGPSNRTCQALPSPSQVIVNALGAARNAGVVVVLAAGNDNCNVPVPMSTVAGVLSVSAVDLNGRKAPYSNFGSAIDVAAPGGDASVDRDGNGVPDGVVSTMADDSGGGLQFVFEVSQGTSMAAPHMAGVVALMLAVNPNLTPDDINALLAGTHSDPNAAAITRDLGAGGRDNTFGHGLIDAFLAVNVARSIAGGSGAPPPVDAPVLAVSPNRLNFGAIATSLQLLISNAGTGQLDVSSITADVPWITLDTATLHTVTVMVDRSSLPDGTGLGSISFVSNGGDKTVPVSVGGPTNGTRGDVGTVFVLVVDTETLETVEQATTSATQNYAYRSPGLPAGSYFIVAGSDRDNDGLVCDNGEACGLFPLTDSPTAITVEEGDVTAIDFPVALSFPLASAAATFRVDGQLIVGFKRLDGDGGRR